MDCPACGSPVTLEVGPNRPLSASVTDAVLAAEEDERIEVARNCWDCGWHETRELHVASIDTTAGDTATIERAAFVDEIIDELAEIDRVTTLKKLLAEIRQHRRTDSVTTDTDDQTTE